MEPQNLNGAPAVVVLASGRGERFRAAGGTGSKLDALLAGQTVLARTVAAARASGLAVHVEHAGHPGMGDSIAAAVGATPHAAGWLVLPGDLPLVAPSSIQAVAAALSHDGVVLPRYGATRGHPVGFGPACRDALLQLTGAQGAAAVASACAAAGRMQFLDLDDPGIVTDIDTPADLLAAEALLAKRAP